MLYQNLRIEILSALIQMFSSENVKFHFFLIMALILAEQTCGVEIQPSLDLSCPYH